MDILALYTRPKLFWIELEKKLTVIKEQFCKKQVEVREVKLKKPVSGMLRFAFFCCVIDWLSFFSDSSNPGLSPAERDAGSSTESPAPPSQSKLLSSPSFSQPASQKSSPQNDIPPFSLPATANQIVANGGKAKGPVSPKRQSNATTATSSPAPKKRKVDTLSPDPALSPVIETDKNEERVKPIISPIRVAKASGSDTSSETGSSPRENGIPEQYRQDFTQHKQRSKAHRHHHHHHHHHRSSKPQHDRHHHHRQQERERESRERDRERERVRDREDDRRRRDQPSSKARRTEYERYR